MIHIIDDVFPDSSFKSAQEWGMSLPANDTWFENKDLGFGQHLLNIASDFFDVKSAVGCEMHINSRSPLKHFDKDEGYFMKTGKLSFPLCGIVWYPVIDMVGGHLLFPDAGVEVRPITNRLVVFAGHLLHDGTQYTGTRKSVGINPWKYKPLTYTNAG
jgi:hypothetical protein